MDRRLVGGIGLVALVALAATALWIASPRDRADLDLDRVARSDIGAPAQGAVRVGDGQPRMAGAPDGVGGGATEGEAEADGATRAARSGEGPALKRLRAKLRELQQEVPDEAFPEGLTPGEEDALLVKPIQAKVRLLDEMTADVLALPGDDTPRAVRARLLLADAHTHMAGFFVERPVPSYLDEQGRSNFLNALADRADAQRDQAGALREDARSLAQALPADHPLRERLR